MSVTGGLAFNEMVRNGELKAPIVIGRDHLDTGSVASPNRETESMLDGSDAVSDWPLLNGLLNTAGEQRGYPCIMAAASGWGIHNTPGWLLLPMVAKKPKTSGACAGE